MRKKILKLGLFICFLFLISGCETKETGEEVSDGGSLYDQDDLAAENEDYIVVGYCQVGSESDWRLASTESFREAFSSDQGYYLIYEDAQNKQENQLKAIRNFILQEVDYIILDPIVETGWDAVLQEAKDADIPVIVADRQVNVQDEDLYCCWVGSDFVREGYRAGEWLDIYLNEQGRSEENIQIVTLLGTLDSSAQIGRSKGFDQAMEEHQNWTMLEEESADFTQAKAREVMDDILSRREDIDVVVCQNDNMAFGAVEAIQNAGRTCGPAGDIIIISFDGVQAALRAMMEGEINVTFECNPHIGPLVSEIIQKLERGEEVEKIQYVEENYFDASMDLEKVIGERTY